jgi:hypothetical protein
MELVVNMVYNPLIPSEHTFNILEDSPSTPTRPVVIKYNGTGLHQIAGPTPFITFNRSVNKSDSGYSNSNKVSLSITGKIIRTSAAQDVVPPGTGISSIVGAIDNFKNLFMVSGYNGVLRIDCGSSNLFTASGVRVNSFNADKSADNWVFSADYSIDLEYFEYGPDNQHGLISSSDDSWTIEPLDELIFTDFSTTLTTKSETHNPNLPGISSITPINLGVSSNASNDLKIYNIPQYKISHRVSAVGLPIGTGNNATYNAYNQAKKWVENRLASVFTRPSNATGLAHFGPNVGNNPLSSFSSGTVLYNHMRNTSFNISNGSYEISDTWLAMPTGVKYIEDYDIETSVDDKFITTVTIKGEIKGLNLSDISMMSGQDDKMMPNNAGLINIASTTGNIPDNLLNSSVLDDNTLIASKSTKLHSNKYLNANSGWLYDIKPYLYRRASLVINSIDRDRSILNPINQYGTINNNPIYCKQNLLNIIPISTSEGHNPRKGTISYSYQFNNKTRLISGVLFENITISDTNPNDVISEAFVLGRRLGPVLQSLGSRTSSVREVTIEIGVIPPSSWGGLLLNNKECPLWTGGPIFNNIQQLLEGLKPFGDRATTLWGVYSTRGSITNTNGQVYTRGDTESWNPVDGRYTRTVGWIHQQCNNNQPSSNI